jgi:hypothetical protein
VKVNERRGVQTIISGGQTGADQGALAAARELGLNTGGVAPSGWLTENGPQEILLRGYGLRECPEPGYPARTRANVVQSDGTLIAGSFQTGGSALTAHLARDLGKPLFTVALTESLSHETVSQCREWLSRYAIGILNVAGNRESQSPGIGEFTRYFLITTLQ